MSKTMAGRRPLSSRTKANTLLTEDIFGNRLAIPDELKKELKDQGFVGRWVNAKKLYENQGYHDKGWRAYTRKPGATMNTGEALIGNDPTGVIRRGDCILAVKTEAEVAKHRKFLRDKANLYKSFNRERAEELRELAKEGGVQSHVAEGYEDPDESVEDEDFLD